MSNITQPRGSIPIGLVRVGGAEYQVSLNPEFNRFFETLVRRVGGSVGMDVSELLQIALEPVSQGTAGQEAMRATEELRHEVEALRSSNQSLSQQLEELRNQITEQPSIQPIAAMVQEIKDRLA
jgi:methyl coenzyme M reductase subunit C-like uncharacterized protein (methanogenesis marker protein 7)